MKKRLIRKSSIILDILNGAVDLVQNNPDIVDQIVKKVKSALEHYKKYKENKSLIDGAIVQWQGYAQEFIENLKNSSSDIKSLVQSIGNDNFTGGAGATVARLKSNKLYKLADEKINKEEIKESFDSQSLNEFLNSTNELMQLLSEEQSEDGDSQEATKELSEINNLVSNMISSETEINNLVDSL